MRYFFSHIYSCISIFNTFRQFFIILSLPFLLFFFPNISNGEKWIRQGSVTAKELRGIWGNSDNDIYAVGAGGTILHYNGYVWNIMDSGTDTNLNGIGGADGIVYAVGDSGTVLSFNGTEWQAIESGTETDMHDVQAFSSSRVYMVGDKGEILSYDGSEIRRTVVPNEFGTAEGIRFYGIWGVSEIDMFAAGTETIGNIYYFCIYEYDGNNWIKRAGINDPDFSGLAEIGVLYDVFGFVDSGVFFSGFSGDRYHSQNIIMRLRESGFETVYQSDYPENCAFCAISGIWGKSETDFFGVTSHGKIRHFENGKQSETDLGSGYILNDIWGGESDIFAVGYQLTELKGVILKYLKYGPDTNDSNGGCFIGTCQWK